MKKGVLGFVLGFMLAVWAPGASADVLDPLDNGSAPPGTFVLVSYFGYQHLPEFEDKDSNTFDINVDVSYAAFRPVYFAGQVAGHTWGLNAIIPLLHISEDGADNSSGLGDIIVGPFIFLYENPEKQMFLSLWGFLQTPTGKYDENKSTNPGYDAWWFEPQLAFGWYPAPFGIDANLNWWIKGESDKLDIDYPDAIEAEAVVHYAVTDKFRVGVQGAYWHDLDDYSVMSIDQPDTKGENFKLGFNLGYSLSENFIVNLRYMHDVSSENYTKGSWTYLRCLYVF